MPFTWEMPYAKEEKVEIQEFLRGPDETMTTKATATFKKCHNCVTIIDVAQSIRSRGGPWNTSVAISKENEDFVRITKTRKWFEDSQAKVPEYKSELELLNNLMEPANERKRARLD
ncbi:hypothetical protein V7S43_007378 [Phytophthora oleae]|uniref:HTH CENPB-type domain-containing protein n=1 Tax=Phytophthora oleae TaxID=2107226 RepID=A0ABD3FM80_9STRA